MQDNAVTIGKDGVGIVFFFSFHFISLVVFPFYYSFTKLSVFSGTLFVENQKKICGRKWNMGEAIFFFLHTQLLLET